MKEYKREKANIESQLLEVEKRSKHHDDHLQIIDVWFDQVITKFAPFIDDISADTGPAY